VLETTGRCDDMAAFGAHREVLIVGRLNPMRAGVRARSALAAALVMTGCRAIAGGVLLLVLYRSLESTAQGAAAARAEQISTQLRTDAPREVDPSLLVTDSQIGAVQIVDSAGTVLAASNGAPTSPLVTTSLSDGQARSVGRVQGPGRSFDYWVSARATAVPGGSVTILVGADREPVESVVTKVAALLAVGSPVIIALVVVGTYRLVGSGVESGGSDPCPGGLDLEHRSRATGADPGHPRRDRPPCGDDERHAGPTGTRPRRPTPAGQRRLPRAAQPPGHHHRRTRDGALGGPN
jgi:hypothetical protein